MADEDHGSPASVRVARGAVLTPAYRAALRLCVLNLLVFGVLRVGFHLVFGGSAGALDRGELLQAFQLGLRFDLRLALLLVLPLLILGHVSRLRPQEARSRRVWTGTYTLLGLLVFLIYVSDFGHYDYLHARLNAAVLDEALSVREATGMVWSSYPVVRWALALALVAALYLRAVRWCFADVKGGAPRSRRARWLSVLAVVAVVAGGIYGNTTWYPLRWSQAYFSTNRYISALALNPVLVFAESLDGERNSADESRLARDSSLLRETYGVRAAEDTPWSLARWVESTHRPEFVPNLVVIHVESWAAFQNGFMGNPLDSSPNMDALAAESVVFERFFVPSGPTARSVFSMLSGVPDIPATNSTGSASRKPAMVEQHMLVNALEGWSKFYFLGGSANWANIRSVTQGNIDDLTVFEEGSYGRDRADIWGISDLEMFEVALGVFDQEPGPFFAFLQTSGNHRPYTIPEYTDGFVPAVGPAPAVLEAGGFKSLEAYNGFRFMDHCLGRFFAHARTSAWYPSTIFVLYGDHGVPAVNGLPYEHINLTHQHVPMILHAPALLGEPRRTLQPASSLDILPTCLGLMGVPYLNTALGRDLFAPPSILGNFAFVMDGLMLEDGLALRYDGAGARHVYRIGGPGEPVTDVSDEHDELRERADRLYRALVEWSKWALFHNKPRPHRPLH